MAVGIGFDIHRLVPGRRLMLGGIVVDERFGALAHSDGDVLLHALVDALLGASGGGDIGTLFPDTDPRWKDAAGDVFVAKVVDSLRGRWMIVNADLVVFLEQPKVEAFREAIRRRVAELLRTEFVKINLKAKTMEGLGPIGAREAVAAQAIVELAPIGK